MLKIILLCQEILSTIIFTITNQRPEMLNGPSARPQTRQLILSINLSFVNLQRVQNDFDESFIKCFRQIIISMHLSNHATDPRAFFFYWLSELSSISYPELQPNRGWSSCDCSHQSRCEKPSWPFSRFSNKKSYWFFFFTFSWIDWNIHSRSSLIKFSSIHLQDLITFDAWKKTYVNCQLLHFKF